MNLLIFGPQASGKGTQAIKIAEHYKILHISTGDIFRDNISRGTELGKLAASLINDGNLVPDEVTNRIVEERIAEDDCKNGFILDGYPRTRPQAEFLDTLPYKMHAAIDLKVSETEVIKRISSRRVCSECQENYNLIYIKPKKEDECDKCGGKLIHRDDDKPDAIKKRLNIYHSKTEPLLDFYKTKGLLKDVNGGQEIDQVFEEIIKILSALQQ